MKTLIQKLRCALCLLQWYVFAGKELHWDYNTIDNMDVEQFFDVIVLYDKMLNPEDYVPVEDILKPFM